MRTDTQLARRLTGVARIAAGAGIAIAATSMFGWLFSLPTLVTVLPDLKGVGLVTAICLLLAGVGALLHQGEGSRSSRRVGAALGVLVTAIALMKLLDGYAFPELRIILATGQGPAGIFPTAMSDYSAVALMFLGTALAATGLRDGELAAAVQALASAGIAIALFVLIGFVYDVQAIVRGTADFPMALNTAAAIALVGLAIVLAYPARGPVHILVAGTPGGHLLRGLLPAFFVLPFALGWLRLQGERAGLFET